jgi:hypothetical protein
MKGSLNDMAAPHLKTESWQNGYCTGLENRRPQGLGGSNPSLSAYKADGYQNRSRELSCL